MLRGRRLYACDCPRTLFRNEAPSRQGQLSAGILLFTGAWQLGPGCCLASHKKGSTGVKQNSVAEYLCTSNWASVQLWESEAIIRRQLTRPASCTVDTAYTLSPRHLSKALLLERVYTGLHKLWPAVSCHS